MDWDIVIDKPPDVCYDIDNSATVEGSPWEGISVMRSAT